ncbi:MAG: BatA domain-containing protein, partial [Planctomycetes bacterium]|nr:BatA domain-containing protein [Planctomycetota bacterium]
MIELAAPWLLLAAPVAAAPVLLHLVRRRRPRDLGWGAMRFL